MAELYFQVNVPTRHAVQPERCGCTSSPGARRPSRMPCASRARRATRRWPHRRRASPSRADAPDGWGARGVRSGWVFDWAAATVAVWEHDRSFWEARPLLPLDAPRSR